LLEVVLPTLVGPFVFSAYGVLRVSPTNDPRDSRDRNTPNTNELSIQSIRIGSGTAGFALAGQKPFMARTAVRELSLEDFERALTRDGLTREDSLAVPVKSSHS
jgi:hypothetical protein